MNRGSPVSRPEKVTRFANVPNPGVPEGIAVSRNSQIAVGTFYHEGPSHIFVFNVEGRLLRDVTIIDKVPSPLLGVIWKENDIYAADFGNGRILLITPDDKVTEFAELPQLAKMTPGPTEQPPGPNGLAFDRDGGLYVSDSFQGVVWRITSQGQVSVWKRDVTLVSTKELPFGANGITFTPEGDALLVANSGEGTIFRIAVSEDGSAGAVMIFADDITAPDGIAFGPDGNLWVLSPAATDYAVVVFSPTGERLVNVTTEGFNGPTSLDFLGDTLLAVNLGYFTEVKDYYIAALPVV
ncbi:MAG: SMP-30/gluconolactonase/LRE family protein [Dehalococcoidia bacterium]|nr:SMP-30/gluconolactonase/LRE family protein [Dehalococcoidia bacterium]